MVVGRRELILRGFSVVAAVAIGDVLAACACSGTRPFSDRRTVAIAHASSGDDDDPHCPRCV
ncbi:MAG TPA: hypothetical protein DCK98_07150 [Chloroflexi bacterium]|nr:hypothetical protein [Chloroflexota bacterium]